MLLVAAVAPAFFEELLFRGFLLPALEPMGKRRAVLLSGVMFAMLHGRIEALPVHLLLGILLAALVLKTGSLFAAVLFHGAYNGILLLASYMLAQTNPASLDTMPTLAQSVQNLPLTISLLAVWGLLTYTAMQRGSKMKKNPLPSATRAPLTTSAKVLLVITFILLIAIEVVAFIGMLPGAGA